MLYQIEMIADQFVFFTIDLELLKHLDSDEGKNMLVVVDLFHLQFPTHILRNNEVHSRHWTVGRRLKNTKILGKDFQMTGINLDIPNLSIFNFSFVYSYY